MGSGIGIGGMEQTGVLSGVPVRVLVLGSKVFIFFGISIGNSCFCLARWFLLPFLRCIQKSNFSGSKSCWPWCSMNARISFLDLNFFPLDLLQEFNQYKNRLLYSFLYTMKWPTFFYSSNETLQRRCLSDYRNLKLFPYTYCINKTSHFPADVPVLRCVKCFCHPTGNLLSATMIDLRGPAT